MMAVRLTEVGGQVLDVTRKIMVDRGITVTQELERRAFERTVDDVRLTLNNISGEFSAFFANIRPTTRYRLEVYSPARRIFAGYVDNPSVDFSRTEKTATIDAFSTTKLMWERAKVTKVLPLNNYLQIGPYIDLQTLLSQQSVYTNFYDSRFLFSGFDCGAYASRQIRTAGVTTNPSIGNEGMFISLSPETTWDDFLKACAMQYNAEFFIDPETNLVTMVRRGKGLSASTRSLDAILVSTKDISVKYIDDQKIDWLYVHSGVRQPPPTVLSFGVTTNPLGPPPRTNPGLNPGTYSYIVTGIIDGVEGFVSLPATVILPFVPQVDGQNQHYQVTLRIYASPVAETTARKLYRFSSDAGQLGYRLITYLDDNVEKSFTDAIQSAFLIDAAQPTTISTTCNQWVQFVEASSGWGGFILDVLNGQNRPAGTIFEAAPKLTFIAGGVEIVDDPFWVYSLFGRERNFSDPEVQADWADMFRMRRRLDCRAKGIDFRVGDRFTVSQQIVPNDLTSTDELIVKKAAIEGIPDEADLTLLTV